MRNARFWECINDGWVKVTVKPDQILTWSRYSRHEEGWSSTGYTWHWDGSFLFASYCEDGTDCDGRMSHESTFTTDQVMLKAIPITRTFEYGWNDRWKVQLEHNGRVMLQPFWLKVRDGQRDYSAEAMGY